MHNRWDAPRLAYELAADWAERAGERTARGGGSRGLFPWEPPEIGKQWHDLRAIEQRGVLTALGDQARAALWELREHRGLAPDESIEIPDLGYVPRMCEKAVETLTALTSPEPAEWKMPECSHCAALLATILINIQVSAIQATGVADPAVVLRMTADGMQFPRQREASYAED